MQTQFDHRVRVVSLANLEAMCARASGMSHRFTISKISRSRIHVTYSNPNEYGTEQPITAVFPCIPSRFEPANPGVIIGELLRVIGSRDNEDWQAFMPITDGPVLWRSRAEANDWRTRSEIDGTVKYICPDGKIRAVDYGHSYTNDTFAAFDVTGETNVETFARIGGSRHFAYFSWSDLRPVKE